MKTAWILLFGLSFFNTVQAEPRYRWHACGTVAAFDRSTYRAQQVTVCEGYKDQPENPVFMIQIGDAPGVFFKAKKTSFPPAAPIYRLSGKSSNGKTVELEIYPKFNYDLNRWVYQVSLYGNFGSLEIPKGFYLNEVNP